MLHMKTLTEFYETPETCVQEFMTEGILCASVKDTSVDDYAYREFEW